MQPIKKKEEFTCQECDQDATVVIEFSNGKYVFCEIHEQEFKENIREQYL